MQFAFKGRDRAGFGVTGQTTREPEEFTRECFGKRWRELRIFPVGDPGNTVGQIGRHPDTGKRIWWAIAELPEPAEPDVEKGS